MRVNLFQTLDQISKRLDRIEKQLNSLEQRNALELSILRNHLMRIKNGENLNDNFILTGAPYRDIAPGEARAILSNENENYILLDVSENADQNDSAIHIPLSELPMRYIELQNDKATPIMVISENGLNSIHACEFLIGKGYYNLNNISGGKETWGN